MLRQSELKSRTNLRTVSIEHVVGRDPRVGESHRHVGAPLEALSVGDIVGSCILRHGRRSSEYIAGDDIVVVLLKRTGDYGVETCDQRSQAKGGAYQSISASADPTRSRRGTARARADGSSKSADTAALSILHHSKIYSKEGVGAGFRPQNVRVGNIQVVARNTNIEIILQRQRNRIIDRKQDLAVTKKLINARCIA